MPLFDDIPLVDGHMHPPLLDPGVEPLARFFTEGAAEASHLPHVRESLFFQSAMRELSRVLRCEPTEAAVAAARQAYALPEYLALLTRDAKIEALLVDDGYPPSGTLAMAEMARACGCRAERVLRIETLVETLFPQAGNAADLGQAMIEHLERSRPLVALKTIIAYRCGLAVGEPSAADVEAAFNAVQAGAGGQRPRLTSKPLLDHLLRLALEWAAEREVPVQFHTGYGDRDLDLLLANPAHLRPLLESPRFERLTIVLLHAGYPYSREASYLASVYPRVFVDWSEVNPMLGPKQLARLLQELLALAPVTKLLYGSDAWGIPDWLWLGARFGRAALAAALEDEPQQHLIARRILRDNAYDLYRLS